MRDRMTQDRDSAATPSPTAAAMRLRALTVGHRPPAPAPSPATAATTAAGAATPPPRAFIDRLAEPTHEPVSELTQAPPKEAGGMALRSISPTPPDDNDAK